MMTARFTMYGARISENWSIFILIKSYQDIHFWKALEILHVDLFLVFRVSEVKIGYSWPKLGLQGQNLASEAKIRPPRPKSARGDGWKDGWMDGRMEIHPCVLRDIGPLGLLPCFSFTFTANHDKQGKGITDHMISLDD